MRDQGSVGKESPDVKYDRALALFTESVLAPDHQLRGCAHNQGCFDELMEIRKHVLEYLKTLREVTHHVNADEKTAMYNYYKSVDSNGDPQWIIPEAEIDEIFALKHIFYIFKTQQLAVDNCYDWFPQPQNLPNSAHRIPAYVVAPNGTIPYENADPTPPG